MDSSGCGRKQAVSAGNKPSVIVARATMFPGKAGAHGTGSSISKSGNNLTVNVAATFKAAFTGQKNIYVYAAESATNTGWGARGHLDALTNNDGLKTGSFR
jgi:hypothetical protein